MNDNPPKLLVIVGETASGKTALAIELAKQFNGEIICADSATVRREANIGSAKPTPEEQAAVKHHLIDVAGPNQDFTAAAFKELANKTIQDIANRGKLPIMVGGTGLYIDGVLFDYGFLPTGDTKEREELNKLSAEDLLERAKRLGLDTGRIDTANKRRLIRLIETRGATPEKQPIRQNTLVFGLSTDREILKQRITDRTDAMVNAGLEQEVKGLAERYGWDCEVLQGIGYAQWRDYFEGRQSLAETRQKIIKATLDLAKRQRTWFKRNKSIQWLNTPVKQADVVDRVTTFLTT